MGQFWEFIFEEMNTTWFSQSIRQGVNQGINQGVTNSRTIMPISTTLQMPLRTGIQSVIGMSSRPPAQQATQAITQMSSVMPTQSSLAIPMQSSLAMPLKLPSQAPTQKYKWSATWGSQNTSGIAGKNGAAKSSTRSSTRSGARSSTQSLTRSSARSNTQELAQGSTSRSSWFYAQPPLRNNTFSSIMGSLRSSAQNDFQLYSTGGTSSSSLQMPPRMQYELTYRLPPRMPPPGLPSSRVSPPSFPPSLLPPPPLKPLTIILVNTSISPSDERHKILLPLSSIQKPLALMTGDYKMCVNGKCVGRFHIDGSGSETDYGVETSLKGVYWNSSVSQLVFTRLYSYGEILAIREANGQQIIINPITPVDIVPASLSKSSELVHIDQNRVMPIFELLDKADAITVNGNYIRIANVRRLVFDVPSSATSSYLPQWNKFCCYLNVEDITFTPTFTLPPLCKAAGLFADNRYLNNITIGKNFFPISTIKAVGRLDGNFDDAFWLYDMGKRFTITISDGTVDDALGLGGVFNNYGLCSLGISSMNRPTTNVLELVGGGKIKYERWRSD